MFTFTCPVCSQPLSSDGVCCRCPKGHSFDIARGGWVNLLINKQSGSKRHGDDALMIRSRTAFLNRGWYSPLLEGIWSLLEEHVHQGMRILDAGCGDGWYLEGLITRMADCGLTAEALGDLLKLLESKTINGPTAKALLPELFEKGGDPAVMVKERGLGQVSDAGAIEAFVDAVLAANPKVVAEVKAGKGAAIGFLVGQVMKQSKGKASPQMVQELLRKKLA